MRSPIVAGRLARPRRRMRAGLVQLLCAAAGLGLGLLLPRITTEASVAITRVTETLVAVGFGVLGLVSIISRCCSWWCSGRSAAGHPG